MRTFPSRARIAISELAASSEILSFRAMVFTEVVPSSSRHARNSRSTSAHQSSVGLDIAAHRLAVDVDEHQRRVGPLPDSTGRRAIVTTTGDFAFVLFEAVVSERTDDDVGFGHPRALLFRPTHRSVLSKLGEPVHAFHGEPPIVTTRP